MENNKPERIRIILLIAAIIGVVIVSAIYLSFSFIESKKAPVSTEAINKDKEKCSYVGKAVLALTQTKGAEIYAQDSTEIASTIASAFKNSETTSNMLREKNKFTAFVTKNGNCSIDEKNCSLNVGMSSADNECIFYLDEKSGIQPSMNTAEFIKEEIPE